MKHYLIESPSLSSLEEEKELYMYLAVLDYASSIILFWQAQEDGQKLVYYVTKTLVDGETRYSQVEKIALTLRVVAKKLCPYF